MKHLINLLSLLLLTCGLSYSQQVPLMPGDLLFYEDTAGMGAAVRESTGQYTHVALVIEVGDTVWIIDATQRYGVSRRPFLRHPDEDRSYPVAYRMTVTFDTAAVIARAKSFVGQPYDDAFLPDNGRMYCSELIYDCFLDATGKPFFKAQPMNWRDKEGNLPEYWKKHFEKLGMPVPEGVPGTNPTDLSQSPLLQKL